jgi:uncharacterized membrane protein HdeD (DUF308 family)
MWKLQLDEKYIENAEKEFIDKIGKYTKIAGVIFILLGLVGIIYPVFMTLATVTFISWLMLFAGLMAGYFTYFSNKSDITGWLKSFILISISVFMLLSPTGGAGTLGLLLSIYFFMDGFASFSIAFSNKAHKGSLIWFINAIFSVLIAILFIIGWPFSSLYLVGLLVGFSLFIDGFALLVGGSIFTKMTK